mmetsp:Transcript_8480/g.23928  ORF Transcript_8480/g.23928 Transcript_8480/m.23928 type:complete len:300 (-) Transcript_8480:347-1246(-)
MLKDGARSRPPGGGRTTDEFSSASTPSAPTASRGVAPASSLASASPMINASALRESPGGCPAPPVESVAGGSSHWAMTTATFLNPGRCAWCDTSGSGASCSVTWAIGADAASRAPCASTCPAAASALLSAPGEVGSSALLSAPGKEGSSAPGWSPLAVSSFSSGALTTISPASCSRASLPAVSMSNSIADRPAEPAIRTGFPTRVLPFVRIPVLDVMVLSESSSSTKLGCLSPFVHLVLSCESARAPMRTDGVESPSRGVVRFNCSTCIRVSVYLRISSAPNWQLPVGIRARLKEDPGT